MAEGMQPIGQGGSNYRNLSSTAVKEKIRVEYNTHTKTFGPMGASSTKKIEHLESIEEIIANVSVPTDYTSPTYLGKVSTKTTSKGVHLESDTEGVDKFFSGDASLYKDFISSISKTSRHFAA